MSWLGIRDQSAIWRAPETPDVLIVHGSIVIETRLPQARRLKPLLRVECGGDWPMHLAVQVLPGGALSLVLDQAGEVVNHVVDCADAARDEVLRITYRWDAPRREGWLAVERPDVGAIALLECAAPRPFHASQIAAILAREGYLSPSVVYVAVSDAPEPVGAQPTLMPDTPILTPGGARPAGQLRRGDLVVTPDGAVPILQALHRTVPARGLCAPVRLRAPYFGLHRDIAVAPTQHLLVEGSDVEYLFGRETVRLRAGHLLGMAAVQPMRTGWLVPYVQLLLPGHEQLSAAGCRIESLCAGRLRRKPDLLRTSVLAGLDRATLPEHPDPATPSLRAFDAIVLAENRAA